MVIALDDLLSLIRERKVQLGITDTPERIEAMRNKGTFRTQRKRAMLARIDERAQRAGREPLKASY